MKRDSLQYPARPDVHYKFVVERRKFPFGWWARLNLKIANFTPYLPPGPDGYRTPSQTLGAKPLTYTNKHLSRAVVIDGQTGQRLIASKWTKSTPRAAAERDHARELFTTLGPDAAMKRLRWKPNPVEDGEAIPKDELYSSNPDDPDPLR